MLQSRVAIIDLGTNSVRFDVHQIGPKGGTKLLHREKLMVRLGEDVFVSGKLAPDAVRRTLQAFSSFHRVAEDLRVKKIIAFATSALREVSDSGDFLKQIRTQTGIDLRVISGEEEARLIALGVMSHKRVKGKIALVDIGGGSTEISPVHDRKVIDSESFPLGTARLQQLFLKKSPPVAGSVEALRRHVKSTLLPKMIAEDWPKVERILGSSGTIKAIAKMAKKDAKKDADAKMIDREWLRKFVKNISQMTPAELLKVPGMEPKRTDMILAGALLLEECMDAMEAKKVSFTEYCLRDGILETEIRDHSMPNAATSKKAQGLASVFIKAASLGRDDRHLRRLVASAQTLFDRLKPLHRLDARWVEYLKMAVILRNVGKAISSVNHEEHSYYIVRNIDLPVEEKWESELVAQLCLHHSGQKKIAPQDMPFKKDAARALAFQKLLALLHIVDALDTSHTKALLPEQVRLQPKLVQLLLGGGHWVELAKMRIQSKKALFEKVYSRTLRADLQA